MSLEHIKVLSLGHRCKVTITGVRGNHQPTICTVYKPPLDNYLTINTLIYSQRTRSRCTQPDEVALRRQWKKCWRRLSTPREWLVLVKLAETPEPSHLRGRLECLSRVSGLSGHGTKTRCNSLCEVNVEECVSECRSAVNTTCSYCSADFNNVITLQ